MELSIIIPSLRKDDLKFCLESIRDHTGGIDYEVLIVAPFGPWEKYEQARWIHEKEPKGVVHAVNVAWPEVRGIWVTTFSDEARAMTGWAKNMIDFLRRQDNPRTIGNFRVIEHGEHCQFYYYGQLFATFPFARKSAIEALGGLFDPVFGAFYADPDLGMRAWERGGQVVTCPNAFIYHPYNRDRFNKENRRKFETKDKETFQQRWGHLEGPGRPFYLEAQYVG